MYNLYGEIVLTLIKEGSGVYIHLISIGCMTPLIGENESFILPATAVQSQSGAYASLLVNKIPPFPWIFALILYPFSG